jgi:hypothetical protein
MKNGVVMRKRSRQIMVHLAEIKGYGMLTPSAGPDRELKNCAGRIKVLFTRFFRNRCGFIQRRPQPDVEERDAVE